MVSAKQRKEIEQYLEKYQLFRYGRIQMLIDEKSASDEMYSKIAQMFKIPKLSIKQLSHPPKKQWSVYVDDESAGRDVKK